MTAVTAVISIEFCFSQDFMNSNSLQLAAIVAISQIAAVAVALAINGCAWFVRRRPILAALCGAAGFLVLGAACWFAGWVYSGGFTIFDPPKPGWQGRMAVSVFAFSCGLLLSASVTALVHNRQFKLPLRTAFLGFGFETALSLFIFLKSLETLEGPLNGHLPFVAREITVGNIFRLTFLLTALFLTFFRPTFLNFWQRRAARPQNQL